MALTILTGSSQAAGINYSFRTSGSADWTSVPTASYFYDIVDKLPRFKASNSDIQNVITFPFTGSALITGSLGVTGSARVSNLGVGDNSTPSSASLLSVRNNLSTAHDLLTIQNGLYGNNIFRIRDNATTSQSTIGSIFVLARIYGSNSTVTGNEFDLGGYGLGAVYGENGNNAVWLNNQGNIGDGAGTSVISVASNVFINLQTTKKYKFEAQTGHFGIGNVGTLGARLDIKAQGALSTDIAFRVRNSADSANIATIQGDGSAAFGTYTNPNTRLTVTGTTFGAYISGNTGIYAQSSTTSGTLFAIDCLGRALSGANTSYGIRAQSDTAGVGSTNFGGRFHAYNGTTNYAGYFDATGGTNNYALVTQRGFSGFNKTDPSAIVDIKAQGALSTDIAFRVRNSADTRDIFNIRGNKTIELIADTPNTNGGISIIASAYNEPTINMYDSFGSKKLIIDTPNALIGVGGSGNIKIGSLTTTNSYLGLVTPTTNNRFLKLVDAFNNEYLSLGGNAYDGGGGVSMTLKTTTTNGTNFVTFSRSNNTNPVVISDLGYLGVGSATASARLDVKAQGALSTDIAFRVRNSADNLNILQTTGDGKTKMQGSTYYAEFDPANGIFIGNNYGNMVNLTGVLQETSWFNAGADGKLAVGRTSASYRFHVNSSTTNFNIPACFNVADSELTGTVGIAFTNTWTGDVFGNVGGVLNMKHTHLGGNGALQNCQFDFNLNYNNSTPTTRASITGRSNILIGTPTENVADSHTIYIQNGTSPTASITDGYKQYSADIVAGNAAPHFRTENGSVVKLYKQDLPTSPTNAEIATLLSNLGLANLI